jgi:DNA ligase-4
MCLWTLLLLLLLQIGLSQQKLMDVFHPDALYLLQMTSDLQYVCSKLADPNMREPRMVSQATYCRG